MITESLPALFTVLPEQDQSSPLRVVKNTRPVVVAGGRLALPGHGLPMDP